MAGTIPQEIQRINAEVAAQAAKIATVSGVLTEKGSTSNAVGETAATPIAQNTTDLDALIAKANALPDAGSGGGGGAVETCTVIFNGLILGSTPYIGYTTVSDGKICGAVSRYQSSSMTFNDVLCGSAIDIGRGYIAATATDGKFVTNSTSRVIYEAPSTAGVTATVTLYD